MQVHDELVFEVPEAELDWARTEIPRLMAGVAELKVPLLAEVGVGRTGTRRTDVTCAELCACRHGGLRVCHYRFRCSHRRSPITLATSDVRASSTRERSSGKSMSGADMRNAGATAGQRLLEVSDVSVRFGGIVALDGVSFGVEAGQIAGLIGPNGAGKTTLFNCLSRLYHATAASVRSTGARCSRCRATASPRSASAGPSRTSRCSAP